MAILRILTFNVRVNSTRDGDNAWPHRAARAAALIARHRPDVIGFQEFQLAHWDSFTALLPDYGRLAGPKVDNQEPWAYPAIFWNVDRLQLLTRGGFYLSQTPDRFSRDWDSAYTRGAAWAQLRLSEFDPQPLLFLNTHLDNRSEEARRQQAAVLLAQAEKQRLADQPIFITGDFNCDPGSPAYTTLTGGGFRDPYLEAGLTDGPDTGTFHNYTGRRGNDKHRIDWILMRPGAIVLTTVACEILTDAEPPLYPSDHYPVLATIRLEHNPNPGQQAKTQ